MAGRRKYLLADGIIRSRGEGLERFAAEQEAAMAVCPEAARFTDHEVEAFWVAGLYLDMLNPKGVARQIRKARISHPVEVAYDPYRLGRHLFRRWEDPAVRQAFLDRAVEVETASLARLAREEDLADLRPTLRFWGGPALLYFLRKFRLEQVVERLLESYTPEEAVRHQALMRYGRLQLHRFLTESEAVRTPSSWEREKLARRLRLREVQLRTMRRSLHKVSQEHRELQARLRQLARSEHPELRPLADEWVRLRKQLQAMEREQKAELEALTARHQEEQARLRAELALAGEWYRRTLRLRRSWLRAEGG
ncbi:MAG: hypothetical protein ACOY93_18750 [Bacillota bacterium]